MKGVRTNMGHRWVHDDDRVECMYCLCSPLDDAAKAVCHEMERRAGRESAKEK